MPESIVHISVAACDRPFTAVWWQTSAQACAEAAKKWQTSNQKHL